MLEKGGIVIWEGFGAKGIVLHFIFWFAGNKKKKTKRPKLCSTDSEMKEMRRYRYWKVLIWNKLSFLQTIWYDKTKENSEKITNFGSIRFDPFRDRFRPWGHTDLIRRIHDF